MKTLTSSLIFCCVFTFLSNSSIAQHADFSGKWAIDATKGTNAGRTAKELHVTQTKDTVWAERVEPSGKTFVEKITTDGKSFKSITTSGSRKTGTAKWDENGKGFTETAKLGADDDKATPGLNVSEQWSLSDDKKELTISTVISNASGQSMNIKGVYKKM